ncbi:MAG: DUF2505 family protein [Polyangiaceae bacterium]|jgi:hypothetical protein
MAETTIVDEFECTEETYWTKCHFDPEYNRRLYLEQLKFPGWKLLETKTEGDKTTRRVHLDPPVGNLPGPVKKLIGDSFSYTEVGTYDKKTGRYTFTITPSTMADKTKTEGEIWCESIGEKKIKRYARIRVDVKIMMVGGLVEDKVMGDLKASYASAAPFTGAFVKAL